MATSRFTRQALIGMSMALLATAALAHPKLVSSTPADKAEVAAPGKVELHFSETLMPQFSGANLVMTGMPGMADHAPMKVAAKVSGGEDGKTMIITPTQPLPAGSYRVDWRAVSSDTHKVNGTVTFEVK
ncbi:copper homeostasis periplasmic binding protein CopC [Ralstonia sp. UBA689]|uniref:copper homeostasis periplasmic binding protein CopC n=1 Tax=Ralstonia sp. UBA689 TaxID=1947373 RepID=UPI0025DAFCEB|nr:copper homeostasis periplasmic binding protein CopC [Ralstonia sp. UBA689]